MDKQTEPIAQIRFVAIVSANSNGIPFIDKSGSSTDPRPTLLDEWNEEKKWRKRNLLQAQMRRRCLDCLEEQRPGPGTYS